MFGAETGDVKKAQEKKLDVAEIRMQTCMGEWSHQAGYRIRNEIIRGTAKVGETS